MTKRWLPKDGHYLLDLSYSNNKVSNNKAHSSIAKTHFVLIASNENIFKIWNLTKNLQPAAPVTDGIGSTTSRTPTQTGSRINHRTMNTVP